MSDLVKRLRETECKITDEAADEIERLRTKRPEEWWTTQEVAGLQAENERLRAERDHHKATHLGALKVAEENTELRRNFASYLARAYLVNPSAIATICDEQLDRSGALLWYVRKAAAEEREGMSDDMIERVARAIADAVTKWDDLGVWQKQMLRRQARAAIAAMREPTADLTEHPSYLNGEWSRRNIEAYIDATLELNQ